MEEKNMGRDFKKLEKSIEEGWIWTEYDGEDIDMNKFPEPTQEELDDCADFAFQLMNKSKVQQSRVYAKKENGESIFKKVLENMTDK